MQEKTFTLECSKMSDDEIDKMRKKYNLQSNALGILAIPLTVGIGFLGIQITLALGVEKGTAAIYLCAIASMIVGVICGLVSIGVSRWLTDLVKFLSPLSDSGDKVCRDMLGMVSRCSASKSWVDNVNRQGRSLRRFDYLMVESIYADANKVSACKVLHGVVTA